jgi:acetyl/propionyl-CoA carboxylase alpha subunit
MACLVVRGNVSIVLPRWQAQRVGGEYFSSLLGKAAIAIAKACAYEGAGTVEFIMDKEQRFYFLEVNTRLQVEHPVTEMITGIDLVKEQIKIARGEKLSFTQDDLQIQGHAIELRVYAEDPANNFLPNIGNLNTYSLPLGNGIRVDNGYEQGMEVPIYYDPMLAKLIAYGKDRSEAIERMKRAIDDFEIEGVETTLTFGSFVMNHPVFVQGPYDTHFVSQHFSPEMLQTLVSEEEEAVAAIIAAVELNTRKNHKVLQTTENEQFTETAWLKNRRWS